MSLLLTTGIIASRRRGWVDPLAGIPFALRLQTHRGDNVPLGLYQDTACTIPAATDGDPVGGWRDELSGSALIAVQSVSTKRPILKIVSGKPVVRFDGIDDFLHIDSMPTISGTVATAVTASMGISAQTAGRIIAMAAAAGTDTNATTGFVSALKVDVTASLGTYYDTYRGGQSNTLSTWFDFLSRATGSEIQTWLDGLNKQTASVNTTAIAATRLKIGGAWGGSDSSDLWGGDIQNVIVGLWSEADALTVTNYAKTLRPS